MVAQLSKCTKIIIDFKLVKFKICKLNCSKTVNFLKDPERYYNLQK